VTYRSSRQAYGGIRYEQGSQIAHNTSTILTHTIIGMMSDSVRYLFFIIASISRFLLYAFSYNLGGRIAPIFLLIFYAMVSAGCTVVNIEGGRVRHYAGTLRVEPNPGAQLVSISSKSWGLTVDGRSMLIGYGRSRTVIAPPYTCSIIIFAEPNSSMSDDWRRFFITYPNVCLHGER
jgi:hypothetical protein